MNGYYRPNFLKRIKDSILGAFKKLPNIEFDATAGAIGFFVILVAFLEYKVFESVYGSTRDIILSLSVLTVTAFGGVFAEVVLKRNKNATDDQLMYADWIFYISLAMSAFAGFGIWAQASGLSVVDFGFMVFALPEFTTAVFVLITAVTIADILILRMYFNDDVRVRHNRNIARSLSKKTEADLDLEDNLIDFDVQVKSKTEKILRIESHRKAVREQLNTMYGGKVPADVMQTAMNNLDDIMKEVKDNKDHNNDGHIGLPPVPVRQFASETKQPENPTPGGSN